MGEYLRGTQLTTAPLVRCAPAPSVPLTRPSLARSAFGGTAASYRSFAPPCSLIRNRDTR
eukprot:scaffold28336_cov69-Phaeocystis_antarctica.AAC.4